MKILFSAESYPTAEQPFAAFVGEICREMTRQGHEVTVIAPQSISSIIKGTEPKLPQFYIEEVRCEGCCKEIKIYRPYYISIGHFDFFRGLSLKFREYIFKKTACKIVKPDVCYAHFWTSGYTALRYARQHSLPLFVASGEDKIRINKLISHKTLKTLKEYTIGVICVSSKNRDESIDEGLTIKDKCIVLPNSVDHNIFFKQDKNTVRKALGYSKEDFIVAFVGRLYNRKGVKCLSDAIKHLADPNIKALFIGRPTSGKEELPDCKGILHIGPLPHEEIPQYLNASDVFVLPTLAEGCSNAIVEAMACGLPIISSDLPFNYDILNSKNSILVNPTDVDAIANAIKELKENKHRRLMMANESLMIANGLTLKNRTEKIVYFIQSNL